MRLRQALADAGRLIDARMACGPYDLCPFCGLEVWQPMYGMEPPCWVCTCEPEGGYGALHHEAEVAREVQAGLHAEILEDLKAE